MQLACCREALIPMKDFLIAVKRTKWERDLLRYGSEAVLRKIYEIQNHAFDRVYASHLRQKESLSKLRDAGLNADFVFREELPAADFAAYRCVLSLGGDNHFVYVSRFAKSPIAGINSDPASSRGALLAGDTDEFLNFLSAFQARASSAESFLESRVTEQWSRIECTIYLPDGEARLIGTCTSEFSIRNRFPEYMSRYLLRNVPEASDRSAPFMEEKCSGLLCVTGAGSTGWFKNCLPVDRREEVIFPRSAGHFKFLAREALRPIGPEVVPAGNVLEIISEMDGEIIADSDHELSYVFPYGARAILRLHGEQLRVIQSFAA